MGMALMILFQSLHDIIDVKTPAMSVKAADKAIERTASAQEAPMPLQDYQGPGPTSAHAKSGAESRPADEKQLPAEKQQVTTTPKEEEDEEEESLPQPADKQQATATAEVSAPELPPVASQQSLPGQETDEFASPEKDGALGLPETFQMPEPVIPLTGTGCKGTGPQPDKEDWKFNKKKKRPCGGRLNFLFMVIDEIFHVGVWKDFFAGAPPGAWRAWVHCVNAKACRESRIWEQLPGLEMIKTVKSQRCWDLVTVEAQLMKAALGQRISGSDVNQKYLLVSDSTLPAKPFPVVYRELTSYRESDFCFSQPQFFPEALLQYRREGNVYKIERGGTRRSLLVKHSQFAILNRADAKTFSDFWEGVDQKIGWKVPMKSKRWIMGVRGTPAIPSNAFLWYHGQEKQFVGTCADEFALFATCYGTFEPGDWGGECPLNRSTACNDITGLMKQRRCRTLSVGGDKSAFVQSFMNDSGSLLKLPTKYQSGHGFKFMRLGNTSLLRIRHSEYLFVRKFDEKSEIPHYSEIVLKAR